MENKLNIPTEIVDLPSKGLLYPKDNPLSSGKIEMKYMTAKEEDILTNQNFIKSGVVIDKLLQSLIISKINYNDLLIGDKNAIMLASRILSYGANYEFDYNGELEGTNLVVTDGDLNGDNTFLNYPKVPTNYTASLYKSSTVSVGDFLSNVNSPGQGQIYLFYDTGSTLFPAD